MNIVVTKAIAAGMLTSSPFTLAYDDTSPTLRGSSTHQSSTPKKLVDPLLETYRREKDTLIHRYHKDQSSIDVDVVDNNDWLQQCAETFKEHLPDFNDGHGRVMYSNFRLIAEPAGLCADHLSCAFHKCHGSVGGGTYDYSSMACLLNQTDLSSASYEDVAETCNFPPSELPKSITFPKTAADAVGAIKYAIENGLQVSIKSTGHSYTGASTKAGSLMMNMRDYTKYASGDGSIVECDSSEDEKVGDPCTLARARGKDAYIRVGGGQPWSDVYNAVSSSKEKGDLSKAYGVGGGAAGSVGSAGGWLSGGGLSTGYERSEGLGVDQILELELVLPDGSHVKIFPSAWNIVEGYLYPQTSKVSALCNANVVSDESQWDWQPCNNISVAPEDLWMAMRGGGGGTYAVTLSVTYQLFEQHTLRSYTGGGAALYGIAHSGDEKAKAALAEMTSKFTADKSGAMWDEARQTYTLFLVDLLFAPEKIGISDEISIHCGSPALGYQATSAALFVCVGEESFWPEISSAWNKTVYETVFAEKDQELAKLFSEHFFIDLESYGLGPFDSWGDYMKSTGQLLYGASYKDIFPLGVVPDAPLPAPVPDKTMGTYCSVNLPLGLLKSDDESERELVFKILDVAGGEHTTGGMVAKASDGMTAVSPSERISGQSSIGFQPVIDHYEDDVLGDFLSAVYKYAGESEEGSDGAFPGFYEYNHICSDAKTPSKADWTKDCSSEDGDECFSIQESVWGETLYAKLQQIKSAVDPDGRFDCYPCVKPASNDL